MKMADVLHSIADMLDKHKGGDISGDNLGKEASDFQHTVDDGAESGDQEAKLTGVMIAPLQQKLELLKKAVDVPNAFDSEQGAEPDELDQMKQRAGISPVIIDSAAEDNDITG